MAREKREAKDSNSMDPSAQRNNRNEEADILAKAICSKTDTFKKSTRAYTLRTNKEENLKEWKDRWLDTVGKGRFAWANRHPKYDPTPTH
jgi:hypothetical protein